MNRKAEIATAREVDGRIAAAWNEYYTVADQIGQLQNTVDSCVKGIKSWKATDARFRSAGAVERYEARIAKAEGEIITLQFLAMEKAEIAKAIEKAEYKGWSRFFLVKHIHSSQSCSSFRPTTRIGWLPQNSGQTEAEAVAEHGAILCTICYPTAPTEWTMGKQDPTVCSGSGKNIDSSLPTRFGFYSGNYATCPDCGKRTGVSNSAIRIPKHKVAK